MRLLIHAGLCTLLAGPVAAQQAAVAVTQAWARASTPSAQTGAMYVTATSSQPDRLTGASTPVAAMAELHRSEMRAGVMEMRPVPDGLPVTPSTPIHMAPGGYHIMLMGLKQPLRQGDRVPLTLTFQHAGPMTVQAVVAGPGASAPPPSPAGTATLR